MKFLVFPPQSSKLAIHQVRTDEMSVFIRQMVLFIVHIFELSYLFCVFGFVGYFLKPTSIAKPYLPVSAASASKVIRIKLFF
jgi:hypothetical protein